MHLDDFLFRLYSMDVFAGRARLIRDLQALKKHILIVV